MLKNRTIEELHDKYVGHRKFAKVCDLLIKKVTQSLKLKNIMNNLSLKLMIMISHIVKNGKHQLKNL